MVGKLTLPLGLFLALAGSRAVLASDHECRSALWDSRISFAYSSFGERSPEVETAFRAAKNGPSGRRRILDLGDWRLSSPVGHREDYGLAPVSAYEREILELAAGDRVRVTGVLKGAREIALGEFINAGNTNHVWAEAEDPAAVLRLPFASGDVLIAEGGKPPVLVARGFALRFIEGHARVVERISRARERCAAEDPEIPLPRVVGLLDFDPEGRFAEVDRVRARGNARDWLAEVWKPGAPEPSFYTTEPSNYFKYRSLALAIESLLPLPSSPVPDQRRGTYLHEARQFLWDLDRETWALVDWE
jgi:hypothetical protein